MKEDPVIIGLESMGFLLTLFIHRAGIDFTVLFGIFSWRLDFTRALGVILLVGFFGTDREETAYGIFPKVWTSFLKPPIFCKPQNLPFGFVNSSSDRRIWPHHPGIIFGFSPSGSLSRNSDGRLFFGNILDSKRRPCNLWSGGFLALPGSSLNGFRLRVLKKDSRGWNGLDRSRL